MCTTKEQIKPNHWQWSLPIDILTNPVATFRRLSDKPITASLSYLVASGLITSILSGVLSSVANIDYQNPSNCGGSAQIFSYWLVFEWMESRNQLHSIVVFALANELGYVVLAIISGPLLAVLASFIMENKARDLLTPAMSAVCYGMTPGAILGWIPNPFFLIGIMALTYQTVALWAVMGLSKTKSVILVLTWVVVLGVLQDLAAIFFRVAFVG